MGNRFGMPGLWKSNLACISIGTSMTTCNIDVEKMIAFFEGYLAEYDNCFRAYSDIFGLAYTWVEWLEYNMQRALGTCADEAERNMGITEVINSVNRIKYIQSMEKEIKEALNSRLPEIMADRYDNHDERICYYELLLENNITEVPQFELPKDYRFVSYTDNDRDENNKITERKVKSLKEHQLSIFDLEREEGNLLIPL